MKYLIFTFFVLNLLNIITPKEGNEKIIFAWEMNRHGARAPYRGVVNGEDAYKEKWIDLQELSNIGKRMLYLLGVSLRKRYIVDYKLINSTYNPKEIYIRSTDVNRTIESMECLLQGLFPNGKGKVIRQKKILNDEKIIYPLNRNYSVYFDEIINKYNLSENKYALPNGMSIEPIHLFYKPDRELHGYDKKVCPAVMEQYKETSNRQELHDFIDDKLMKNYSDVFLELEGTNNETFLYDYNNLYKYMDGFVCDYTDQRNFKEVEKYLNVKTNIEQFKADMKNFSKEFLWMDYKGTLYPNHNASISGMSPVMRSIINWMEKAKNSTENNETYIKLVLYSAHDSTLGALEDFIEYAFNKQMEYSTFAEVRLIELYQNNKSEYRVRYVNAPEKGEYKSKFDVSYDEFKETIKNYTWTEGKIIEYCKFNSINQTVVEEKGFSLISKAITITLGIIIGLLLIFFVYLCFYKRDYY